ncbi:MAG: B-box zinc finger protein [Promethearchaeota archaeon]
MSEQHFQVCRFCQRKVKLAYYCEECGTSCCSDCLHEEKIDSYLCQECNSKNIFVPESGNKKACKDCGAESIIKSNQLLKSCPKCHSHQIINIFEKKEELEKKFMELIKNSRSFIDPLRDLVNSLYMLKQKIQDARAPPVKCFHYPTMELDLLALFKLFIYAKENLIEKIRNFIQHLSINKEYFFDIYTQQNSNIRIIEDILENLNRSYNSITDFIESNVNTINTSIENISKNLVFIDKITFYFKNYIKFLNLAEEEKPVYAIYAKLANGLNTQDKYKKNKGILFMTNFDLSFVHEYGKRKKKQEGIFKAPVKDLTKVQIRGKLFKKLYIEFPYGRYEFTLPPNSISRVLDYLLLARNFDETVIYDKLAAKKLYNIDIDLSDISDYIEETINSFFSLKCQYNNISSANKMAEYNVASSIFNHNPNNLANSSPLYSQNQFINPFNNNYPFAPFQNYKNMPDNPMLYQNNRNPNQRMGQIQTPEDLNYYGNTMRHYLPPNYNQNEFFLQNFYDTNRIQNYEPKQLNRGFSNDISDLDQKNLLMRKLEQLQRYDRSFPTQNGLYNNNNYFTNSVNYNPNQKVRNIPQFQEYSRNHLSDLFNRDYASNHPSENSNFHSKKHNKSRRKKMFDYEKEKYSLEETLKALDSKFESGDISEIDYFKNFKNLQKEIYIIGKNIEALEADMEDDDFLGSTVKEFDRKRYYT